MPNGKIRLYNKLTNAQLVELDITGIFNIEDNLNDTPSNAKFKVVTTNTYREEFEVNTVVQHIDTNTWWVIKSDESTYLHTGEYEHEIQVVEYLEWYAYKHLPNCAFAPNTYELEQMLERLFKIAKLDMEMVYPAFLDKDKKMPFMSFENFTVANAIKNIARAINAIPKAYVGKYEEQVVTLSVGGISPPSSPSNGNFWFSSSNLLYERVAGAWVLIPGALYGTSLPTVTDIGVYFVNTSTNKLFLSTYQPILTFINRSGLDTAIVETLNTQFPVAYERNINSNDQFMTRSVSNITNAKSSNLVIAPLNGGFKNVTPNSATYVVNDAKVLLPSKIEKIDFLRVFVPFQLVAFYKPTSVTQIIYENHYVDRETFRNAVIGFSFSLKLPSGYTTNEKITMANALPTDINAFHQVNYGDSIDKAYNPSTSSFTDNLYYKKMSLLNKFEFDVLTSTDTKDRTAHWTPNTNQLIMPLSFRNGLFGGNDEDHNRKYRIHNDSDYEVYLIPKYSTITTSPFAVNVVRNDQTFIQVGYYPIADIKVSIDNDSNSQDEKYYNQQGKLIDALSVTKLITSHTNDSVEGTKIRNARYTSLSSILPLGQVVRDSNQLYIITQRSIDATIKNGNEYYNVIYTLTRNRIGRSENIIADGAVINYKIPDDNLVFRTQLYKDYIELSLTDGNNDTPYLSMSKALVLSASLAGTRFDYTVLAKNDYGSTPTVVRYVKSPTIFDLHKSKLMNVNWQDNNVLDFRLDSTGANYVQTPIVYTDSVGKATDFEVLFCDTQQITDANADYNTPTPVIDALVPFGDLTQVPSSFYNTDIISDGRFSIRIQEADYDKDAFEIPVFEYMLQANDDYDSKGNIVVGNDLFSTFTGTLRYHYIINNSTRFTAENANALYTANPPSGTTNKRVDFSRTSATQILMTLYSTFDPNASPSPILTSNTSDITNVGIYVTDGTTVKFLFAINDYTMSSKSIFNVFINNWKI